MYVHIAGYSPTASSGSEARGENDMDQVSILEAWGMGDRRQDLGTQKTLGGKHRMGVCVWPRETPAVIVSGGEGKRHCGKRMRGLERWLGS